MNWIDIIFILIIAVCIVISIMYIRRKKSCCGNCSACGKSGSCKYININKKE